MILIWHAALLKFCQQDTFSFLAAVDSYSVVTVGNIGWIPWTFFIHSGREAVAIRN